MADLQNQNVCDTCGDIGVENALVTCPRCELGRQYAYCTTVYSFKLATNWRGKKDLASRTGWYCEKCSTEEEGGEGGMIVDMEIDNDMIGGQIVGSEDIGTSFQGGEWNGEDRRVKGGEDKMRVQKKEEKEEGTSGGGSRRRRSERTI